MSIREINDFSSVLPKMIPENWWYKDVKSIKTSGIFNIVEPD